MTSVVDGANVPEMSGMRAEVEKVVAVIRPAIQADNGDIELHGVDEATGVVTVELFGACVSCPASTVTLKAGIERILRDRVPGVTEVVNAGETAAAVGETPVSL
jgi:Fe-S cluster biogenesis protein NfuA